jgi:hypothetical protein
MKLVVGYLATPGGADAMTLGARLARTLGAEVEACIILPPDDAIPTIAGTRDYEAMLGEQAEKWLAEALASVPDDVAAHSHVTFDDSFADGLIKETARSEVVTRWAQWSTSCCTLRLCPWWSHRAAPVSRR